MPEERPRPEDKPSDEELERRLTALLGESELGALAQTPPAPDLDEEFEERVRGIQDRAQSLHERRESKAREAEREQQLDRESSRGLGFGLTIAYTIVGTPLLGALIGWLVDEKAGTRMGLGIGTVLGACVGVAMALVILSRASNLK
ncbi:MAG: hypothetical protein HYR64_07040 [Fimbriimonas ginsengisoli]|uniref:AtpZ/AtpI family protein n=1 Tax=Fimbriimonas ginsengisoli TaxID=1005039 RepID=A0A931LSV0_FIMGI|nr:hypothetical protein [Fimbriimonas ginsengisoli]